MLHHLEIYVSDLEASFDFWFQLLEQLGYEETAFWDEGFTLGNHRDAYLTFVQVKDEYKEQRYHRCGVGLNHLAFRLEGREAVDALRAFCISKGIAPLYDDRYPFANGGDTHYALYIEDPDRIKVEFVAV